MSCLDLGNKNYIALILRTMAYAYAMSDLKYTV